MAEARLSLLLVDDDLELCALMTEIFERQNLSVKAVHDGAAGLTAAREGKFDLVILDVMLPVLANGLLRPHFRSRLRGRRLCAQAV